MYGKKSALWSIIKFVLSITPPFFSSIFVMTTLGDLCPIYVSLYIALMHCIFTHPDVHDCSIPVRIVLLIAKNHTVMLLGWTFSMLFLRWLTTP